MVLFSIVRMPLIRYAPPELFRDRTVLRWSRPLKALDKPPPPGEVHARVTLQKVRSGPHDGHKTEVGRAPLASNRGAVTFDSDLAGNRRQTDGVADWP